jgi:hypothetical protein
MYLELLDSGWRSGEQARKSPGAITRVVQNDIFAYGKLVSILKISFEVKISRV